MPAIEYSQGLHNNTLSSAFNLNGSSTAGIRYYSSTWGSQNSAIQLMKGTIQTSFDTYPGSRGSDVLCMWPFGTGVTSNLSLSTRTDNVFTVKGYYARALASGTATWFRWNSLDGVPLNESNYTSTGTNNLAMFYVTGTVGGVGSGADLIMQGFTDPDPITVVSGQRYKIENLVFTFPRTWTY